MRRETCYFVRKCKGVLVRSACYLSPEIRAKLKAVPPQLVTWKVKRESVAIGHFCIAERL
jgi:hypothetical protein